MAAGEPNPLTACPRCSRDLTDSVRDSGVRCPQCGWHADGPKDIADANLNRVAPGFVRRLSYYLIGIAIGLILLGYFQQMRAASRQAAPANPPAEAGGATPDGGEAPPASTPRPGDEQDG